MLSRRDALLAASGTVAFGASRMLQAASGQRNDQSAADIGPELPANVSTDVIDEAAQACLSCSSACVNAMDSLPSQLRNLAADCRDICTVTATLLSRSGPMAPAICQACSDACDRLAGACAQLPSVSKILECRQQALQCAKLCRHHVRAA